MNLVRSIRSSWRTPIFLRIPLYFERRDNEHFEAYRFILPGYNVAAVGDSAPQPAGSSEELPDSAVAARTEVFKELFDGDARFITQRENGKDILLFVPIILNPEFHMDGERVVFRNARCRIGFRMITTDAPLR